MKIDIEKLVNRFLGWPLPKTFAPDCGISFDGRKDDEWNKNKMWPTGTNLFTATEARQLFEHALGQSEAAETGVDLIAAERTRQVEQEGWTPEHDDEHDQHELALAAVCYAAPEPVFTYRALDRGFGLIDPWPRGWDFRWDKRPRSKSGHSLLPVEKQTYEQRIRCLVKAGALIAAEIDRLQRIVDEFPEG